MFFQQEVPFLGKLATTKGIGVDPKKIEAITQWPPPTSHKEVESFLGFAYYHETISRTMHSWLVLFMSSQVPKPLFTGMPPTKRPLKLSRVPWCLPQSWLTPTVMICSFWTQMHLTWPLGPNSSSSRRR